MFFMKTEASFQADSYLDTKAQVSTTDSGTVVIEGMASDWGIDDQDEVFEPGAFQRGIDNFLNTNPVLLYHHDGAKALGRVTDLTETPSGLKMRAEIDPPASGSWAEDIVNKVKSGTIRGLSVRGKFRRRPNPNGGVAKIYEAGLREISVTPLPVNPRTMFAVAAKAFEDSPEDLSAERLAGLQGSVDRLDAVFALLDNALFDRKAAAAADPAEVARWLDALLGYVRADDYESVAALLADGWPTAWDSEIDEMTYAGREEDLDLLRRIVDLLRSVAGPTDEASVAELLRSL